MSAEDDFYVPEPVGMADGDVVIHDPTEFFDLTKSIAALNRDGVLFVLDRETFKWRSVEPAPPGLSRVK